MTGESYLVVIYVVYVALALALILFLARTLSNAGSVFLESVFNGNERLARTVNRLLVIGFYLLNAGWAVLILTSPLPASGFRAVDFLTKKLASLLLVIGFIHMFNMLVLFRIRRRSLRNGNGDQELTSGRDRARWEQGKRFFT